MGEGVPSVPFEPLDVTVVVAENCVVMMTMAHCDADSGCDLLPQNGAFDEVSGGHCALMGTKCRMKVREGRAKLRNTK